MEVSRQRAEGRKARQKTGRASTTTIHVVVDGRGEATIDPDCGQSLKEH